MMYLSDDPTFLVGGLLLLAVGFAFAVRITQQGKYLLYASIAAAMALVVVVVERVWVTDVERIEQVIYDLRRAVANSDVDGVLDHLAPDVLYTRGDISLTPDETRAYIHENLARVRFEFVQINGLEVTVAEQSRRGKADFRILAKGTMETSLARVPVGSASMAWSLGLRETSPGVWKVSRITPGPISGDVLTPPNGVRGAPPNGVRGAPPATAAPDDGDGRVRRKATRGGGRQVDSRFFSNEGARNGQSTRKPD